MGKKSGKIILNCLNCGKEFEVSVQRKNTVKYCSSECYLSTKRNRIKVICQYCSSEFECANVRKGKVKYCSKECQRNAKNKIIKCPCGKEFKVSKSVNRKFCSQKCSQKFQTRRTASKVKITCLYCGKLFEVSNSRKDKAQFCSHACKCRYYKFGQQNRKYDNILTKEFLIKEYIIKDKTTKEIGNELSIHPSVINDYRKFHNIKQKPNRPKRDKYIITKDFLIKEYVGNKKSAREVALIVGCEETQIYRKLKKFGIKIRKPQETLIGEKRKEAIRKANITKSKKFKTRIREKVKVSCSICGKEIVHYKDYVEHKKRDYVCSQDCWAKLMILKNFGAKRSPELGQKLRKIFQTGKYIECEICGKDKYFPINKIKRNERFYCSPECRGKGISKFYVGENAHNYKDGRTDLVTMIRSAEKYFEWRNQVLERDNFTCMSCGKNNNLEVHHLKSFRKIITEFLTFYSQFSAIEDKITLFRLSLSWKDFWNVDYGITYCEKCHEKMDYWRRLKKVKK